MPRPCADIVKSRDDAFYTDGGKRLYYRCWAPEGPTRAVMLLVHGLAEHSGRYREFAEYFATTGFATYAMDHPGHGKSEGRRGHIDRFTDFTDALGTFLTLARQENLGLPIVLVGHSMGGLISAAFLLEHQSVLTACVLSAPAIKAAQQPSGLAVFVSRAIAILFPRLGLLQLDANGVSRDPKVVDAYRNDPLVYTGKITVRLAVELHTAMGKVLADAAKIRLPILVLQGASDTMTAPEGSQMLHDTCGSADKDIIVYDGLYHEIFNEPERAKVMDDMRLWLESRLP